jgi:hypothetical protein
MSGAAVAGRATAASGCNLRSSFQRCEADDADNMLYAGGTL